uniref:Uncharacterized protein n=1 Tax=Romanomermis culicivorax TaxID=13658 RepID=A0A915JCI0_ROMCU
MPPMRHTPPDQQHQNLQSSLPNAVSNAACRILNLNQQNPLTILNPVQPSVPPLVSLPPLDPLASLFSNDSSNGSATQQVPQSSKAAPFLNSVAPPVSGQILSAATANEVGPRAMSQVGPPQDAMHHATDPNIDPANSTNSFVNLDPSLAWPPPPP